MNYPSPHTFHIPVMGLAYTIDSPIKVARFGISSVISIVEDRLVEMMRSYYYPTINQEYKPIGTNEEDYRAKRITDYLDLVHTIVTAQVEKIRKEKFAPGSEIVKYFELLPDDSELKRKYRQLSLLAEQPAKEKLEAYLRQQIRPGRIDVNIMTKTDRDNYDEKGELIQNGSDAVAALRGYANSKLTDSTIVFSAGMNPRLYNYLENCKEFDVNEDGGFGKKVAIKVSDYRSALIQGKYLAKKGVWVSEFRIESGLNCGGHAFATEGYLLGPILDEFKLNRQELIDTLFETYNSALYKKTGRKFIYPPRMVFSAQGGIGTHEEDFFLRRHYDIESTGWGTPFLLVPETTTVDDATLELLSEAKEKDITLSRNSPMGVRFHYLKGTTAAAEKAARINNGQPGSPCTEKHLAFNTEFTKESICTASRKYQALKIAELQSLHLPEPEYKRQLSEVLDKECLCVGLSNAAAISYKQTFVKKLNAVTICPGPNIVNFSKVVSLKKMVAHIYGRTNILATTNRPHMFITELNLYIDYLKEQLKADAGSGELPKRKKYYHNYYQNLRNGIKYYRSLPSIAVARRNEFFKALYYAEIELDSLNYQYTLSEKG